MSLNELEELKTKRMRFVNEMKDNDAFDGIKNLLSEMYPAKAHFIYELLQNAEDVKATYVKFELQNDKLIFTHNGIDFTIKNIESITNIGKSQKKDDYMAIGKFGVGFKAVYSYTKTPEIHSGDYDFKIRDMLIPDTDVIKSAKKDITQFIFPFDVETKSPQDAVSEIRKGLLDLDETTLLFLNYIKSIEFVLPNGDCGHIKIIEDVSEVKFIKAIEMQLEGQEPILTYWSKFKDKCQIFIDGEVKSYEVAIAYGMNFDAKTSKFTVNEYVGGKVCISFPTDVTSLLHFHINAPFSSTVARDNIKKDCPENEKLISAIAKLTVESLYYFRNRAMLDYEVYKALPTMRDFKDDPQNRFKEIAKAIKEEFEKADLFITDKGQYKTKDEVRKASRDIKSVITADDVEQLYGYSWLPTFLPATRIDFFMDQFQIKDYTGDDIVESLEKDNKFFDEVFSNQSDAEYFEGLYYVLSQARDRVGSKSKNSVLKSVAFLHCENDDKLHTVDEKLFLHTEYQPKYSSPTYLDVSFKNTKQDKEVKSFLLELGVKEMNEGEDFIADIVGEDTPIDYLLIKMLDILKEYLDGNIDVCKFADSRIFVAKDIDGHVCRVMAKECCWSKESAFFFKNTQYILAQEYYEEFNEYREVFKEVFEKLGGKITPKIILLNRLTPDNFPLYHKIQRGYRSQFASESNYSLDEFQWDDIKLIKQNCLIKEALLLWKMVLKFNDEKVLYAKYRPNGSAETQEFESTLVYYLKNSEWVPVKDGSFRCPCEVTQEELLDEFVYDNSSVLLNAISGNSNKVVDELTRNGIDDKNLLAFAKLDPESQMWAIKLAEQLQNQMLKTGKSLIELAADSDRDQSLEEDDFSDSDGYGKPINIEKRKIKLEKEFDDREEPVTRVKKLQFVLAKPCKEEKVFVREQYHSYCQICKTIGILTASGKRYFEAINIFNTKDLDESYQIKMEFGWNTLSLCPKCAAKFKYSQLTISGLLNQVELTDTSKNSFFDIPFTLENKLENIRFTQKHLLALQVAIKKLKE